MLSKSDLKYLRSLHSKKYRKIHQAFLVEGAKSILELLHSSYKIDKIFVTEKFILENTQVLDKVSTDCIVSVSEKEIKSAGTYKTNDSAIAVACCKEQKQLVRENDEFVLLLDAINDPGNLGSIIRIADWFGIKKVICSEETVDVYSPKVIASTKGSFTRVDFSYSNLEGYLKEHKNGLVYGAYMKGKNVHTVNTNGGGYIVIGSESHGISEALSNYIDVAITIPKIGAAESLNAAMATAIICDNLISN